MLGETPMLSARLHNSFSELLQRRKLFVAFLNYLNMGMQFETCCHSKETNLNKLMFKTTAQFLVVDCPW